MPTDQGRRPTTLNSFRRSLLPADGHPNGTSSLANSHSPEKQAELRAIRDVLPTARRRLLPLPSDQDTASDQEHDPDEARKVNWASREAQPTETVDHY